MMAKQREMMRRIGACNYEGGHTWERRRDLPGDPYWECITCHARVSGDPMPPGHLAPLEEQHEWRMQETRRLALDIYATLPLEIRPEDISIDTLRSINFGEQTLPAWMHPNRFDSYARELVDQIRFALQYGM
jgi:hypothetical protein